MNAWVKNNSWALIVGAAAVISSYGIFGYRVAELERAVAVQADEIAAIQAQQIDTQVTLAEIQKDIQYIKVRVDRLPY